MRFQKYRNKRLTNQDGKWDSKAEYSRWTLLKLLEQNGDISNLRRQVPFTLEVCGNKVGKYVADFCYVQDGAEVVEDVKGMLTPVYRLKKRLMKAIYGIDIHEVKVR